MSEPDRKPVHEARKALRGAGPYVSLGLETGLTMIAWVAIGYLLDQWLSALPWFTIAGMFLGMASIALQIARIVRNSTLDKTRRKPNPESEH